MGTRNRELKRSDGRVFLWFRKIFWAFLILCAVARPGSSAITEYDAKAAYLYNFGRFVTWPASVFSKPESPFRIAVVGEDPFGGALDGIAGKMLETHPVEVKNLTTATVAELKGFQMVFFAPGFSATELSKALAASPVLTVSEGSVGIIRFVKLGLKIGFSINQAAAKKAGLNISAKLMQLAVPQK
jgi:hypothetical protein